METTTLKRSDYYPARPSRDWLDAIHHEMVKKNVPAEIMGTMGSYYHFSGGLTLIVRSNLVSLWSEELKLTLASIPMREVEQVAFNGSEVSFTSSDNWTQINVIIENYVSEEA